MSRSGYLEKGDAPVGDQATDVTVGHAEVLGETVDVEEIGQGVRVGHSDTSLGSGG